MILVLASELVEAQNLARACVLPPALILVPAWILVLTCELVEAQNLARACMLPPARRLLPALTLVPAWILVLPITLVLACEPALACIPLINLYQFSQIESWVAIMVLGVR